MEAELITPEKEILQKLNELTGSNFREIKSNLTKISALFKQGFTQEQIIEVIILKVAEWKNNPVMAPYLRPSTLFRDTNFENYVNQVNLVKQNPKLYEQYFKNINKIKSSAADNADDIAAMYG